MTKVLFKFSKIHVRKFILFEILLLETVHVFITKNYTTILKKEFTENLEIFCFNHRFKKNKNI